MPSDYQIIREEHILDYGRKLKNWAQDHLANRYADRTHFIYELIQNAEDALRERGKSILPSSILFNLKHDGLEVRHYGKPFTPKNVRSICAINESTKDELTEIGRFGIGFKSVYSFTKRPEVHSGDEHFEIEDFVLPASVPPRPTGLGETLFWIPFEHHDTAAYSELADAIKGLGCRKLLFLKHVSDLQWILPDGTKGCFLRDEKKISDVCSRVIVIGQRLDEDIEEEQWLVFRKSVHSSEGKEAGAIEIGFNLKKDTVTRKEGITKATDTYLVVFFPTMVQTNLGFLIQGPYRTTPSRDNVPPNDKWNQYLVHETASLLIEALRALREMGLLTVEALRTLPLDRTKFVAGSILSPLFDSVKNALEEEKLLPCFRGGHASSKQTKLGRTKELRELLSPSQVAALYESLHEIYWLSEDITLNRTPELWQYLISELQISLIEPESLLQRISQTFLEAQSDSWIIQFYDFLLKQPSLWRTGGFREKPIIRLEGEVLPCHVVPFIHGQPQAFLPGATVSGFPIVKRSICSHPSAVDFLKQIGLSQPDPVDDVVINLIPKYRATEVAITDEEYALDISRILDAFATDSNTQKEKLKEALKGSKFLRAVDAGDGSRRLSKPTEVYISSQKLKDLFTGVKNVLLVDESYSCLRGDNVRNLLEACGGARYLQPFDANSRFTRQELREMRLSKGAPQSNREDLIEDFNLRGLEQLLDHLKSLTPEKAAEKAKLLWESLCDVEDRRGTTFFNGTYKWFYRTWLNCSFVSRFVWLLNHRAWIPDKEDNLQPPNCIVFKDIDPQWPENPYLQSKIHFKPPIIETLAREAGIEPALLDFLKKHNLTSAAELKIRLGITEETQKQEESVDEAVKQLLGGEPGPIPPIPDPLGPEPTRSGGTGSGGGTGPRGDGGSSGGDRGSAGAGKRTPGSAGGRPFISYVGTHPMDEEGDPDRLSQQERIAIEEKAIRLIILKEPKLKRTPVNNPGYDLVEYDAQNNPVRWIEVKAMTGYLQNRPVCLSHTQFEHAQNHGDAYWLYIVEQANSENAKLLCIQNPAGKARSFTFDHGWAAIAEDDKDYETEDTGGVT